MATKGTTCFVLAVMLGIFALLCSGGKASANPSNTFWTNANSDVQELKTWRIEVGNYFRLYQTQAERDSGQSDVFPTDVGVTVGVSPFKKLNMEVGIDGLFPGTLIHPALKSVGRSLLFNAKIGTPEEAFFGDWFPALNVGIFNVGTKSEVTDMNIVDFLVGKTLGPFGRIHGGGYYGNPGSALMHESGCKPGNLGFASCGTLGLRGARGTLNNSGGMVGYDYGFWKVKDEKGQDYDKLVFLADYASGKNFIGGGGFGITYNFTKYVGLQTGPAWFNDPAINGRWKWAVTLVITNY